MKTTLFPVLFVVLFSPVFTSAYWIGDTWIEPPFAPGSSPNTPIYIKDTSKPNILPGADHPKANTTWFPWESGTQQPQNQKTPDMNNLPRQRQLNQFLYPQYAPAYPQPLTLDQQCKRSYGAYSYGANSSCYCITGYQWANDRKSCVYVDVALQNSIQAIINQAAEMNVPMSGSAEANSGSRDGGSGGTIIITPPTPQAPISPKAAQSGEPTEMEKMASWEKYYGKAAGTITATSTPQTATGILGLFGVLLLLGGVLRSIVG